MKTVTLLFLIQKSRVLLAMKKRGVGKDKWNGVGGKVDVKESIEAAAIRECWEEIGVTPKNLSKVALLDFRIPSQNFHHLCHVFTTTDWEGEITETEEMTPKWFAFEAIPYQAMWAGDNFWLPRVLAGEKLKAHFVFDEHEKVKEKKIHPLK